MRSNDNQSNQLVKGEDTTDHSDLQALPDEVKLLIFSKLDPKSSLAAAVASLRAWYPLIDDAQLWRQRIVARFPYLRALKEEAFQSTPRQLYLQERDFIRDYRNKYNDDESLLVEIASGNLDAIKNEQLDNQERLFCLATVYGWYDPHLLTLEYKLSALQMAASKGQLPTVEKLCASLEGEKNEDSFGEFFIRTVTNNNPFIARIFPHTEPKISLCEHFLIARKSALSHGYTEIAEYLIGHKIITGKIEDSSLIECAQFGSHIQIEYMLASTPSLYDINAKGEALLSACKGGHLEAAKVLLASLIKDSNAETLDAVNGYRITALSIAAEAYELPLLQYLYQNSEDILTSDLKKELIAIATLARDQESISWLQNKINPSKRCLVM